MGDGWNFDGIAFYVPDDSDARAVSLNQFHYNQKGTYGGWRFTYNITMSPANVGWIFDQVICRVYPKKVDDAVPIYQYHK